MLIENIMALSISVPIKNSRPNFAANNRGVLNVNKQLTSLRKSSVMNTYGFLLKHLLLKEKNTIEISGAIDQLLLGDILITGNGTGTIQLSAQETENMVKKLELYFTRAHKAIYS